MVLAAITPGAAFNISIASGGGLYLRNSIVAGLLWHSMAVKLNNYST
jgi:hypothetical protein